MTTFDPNGFSSSEPGPILGFSASYYDPPAIRWWILLIVGVIVNQISNSFLPEPFASQDIQLFNMGWAAYLCIWVRRLNPNTDNVYWLAASFVSQLAAVAMARLWEPSTTIGIITIVLQLGAVTFWVVCFLKIRLELQRHYNLNLKILWTVLFSFLYFQYHLADIAESRRSERNRITLS